MMFPFFIAMLSFIAAAALLSGWLPVGVSMVSVFLCAGPHNWIEARYVLARMPGRWGKLAPFFLLSLVGVLALTASFILFPRFAEDRRSWLVGLSLWNSLLTFWILALALMRGRQNPRRDWSWLIPLAFFIFAAAWAFPMAWDLSLVYLHPFVGMAILDQEIRRHRPAFRKAYRIGLGLVLVGFVALALKLWASPDLDGDDALTMRLTNHAGAGLLEGVSSHFLVSAHTYLELIHYGVWLIGIPWCAGWITIAPLPHYARMWKRVAGYGLALGSALIVLLWASFLSDYAWTRDVYFTVAMVHVLAEVPLLLRAL